jgi:hypothetical protein
MMRFFLSLLHVCLVFSLVAADANKVEEGWRYEESLALTVTNGSVSTDFDEEFIRNVHTPMAYKVDSAKENYAHKALELPTPDDRMFAVFRFTPVIQVKDGDPFSLGNTVFISSVIFDNKLPSEVSFSEGCEFVFASGFFKYKEEKTKLTPDIVAYDAHYEFEEKAKPDVFVRIPSLNASLPLAFIMRNYIHQEYLQKILKFRYPREFLTEGESVLQNANYSKIKDIHEETLKSIGESAKKIETVLNQACRDAATTDITTLLQPIKALESSIGRRSVGNNAKANSYTCAEQVGLDFLSDIRVMQFLKRAVKIEDQKVKGIIVHLHTSQTPCGGSCATSLARECESAGLFKNIFNRKPVKLVCTTSAHYQRSELQVKYDDTNAFNALRDDTGSPARSLNFNICNTHPSPYPVILYGKQEIEYIVLLEKYSGMRRKRI